MSAGRIFLGELTRLEKAGQSFAFESTLSGTTHVARLRRLKEVGYRVEIVYLRIASPQLALRRIAARVKQGGHNIPREDVLRRFERSWRNFEDVYRPLATSGRSMKTPVRLRSCWKAVHES